MNNNRRKSIEELQNRLQDLLDELEIIKDEENEAFENMPESLQESERGQIAQEATSNLDSSYNSLQEAMEYLEEAKA